MAVNWDEFSPVDGGGKQVTDWSGFSPVEEAPKNQDSAIVRGAKNAWNSVKTGTSLLTGDVEAAANLAAERDAYRRANPGTKEGNELMQAWESGDGITGGISNVAGEIAKDWREAPGVVAGIRETGKNLSAMGGGIVEQIPNMIAPMGGMLAGGAAGAATPIPGGMLLGGWAGATAGNTLVESGEQVDRALQAAGIDPQDKEAVRAFIAQNGDKILGQAGTKGAIIGAVDTATMGIGGKMLRQPVNAAIDRAIAAGVNPLDNVALNAAIKADPIYLASQKGMQALGRNAGVAALEPAGEFTGEYLGQGVATGDWDTKGAALEALSSLGQSGITFAGQKLYNAATSPLRNGDQAQAPDAAPPTLEELNAGNAELAGAQDTYLNSPNDMPQLGYEPEVIVPPAPSVTVPTADGGTTEINRDDGVLSAAVVDTGIAENMLSAGMPLRAFPDRLSAQAELESRPAPDRMRIVSHPRVKGALAVVDKDRLTLNALDQAEARRTQLEQEDGNASRVANASGQGTGAIAAGGTGSASGGTGSPSGPGGQPGLPGAPLGAGSTVQSVGDARTGDAALNIPTNPVTNVQTSEATRTGDAALDEINASTGTVQPVSSMPGIVARDNARIQQARAEAEARGARLVDEEAQAANTAPSEAQITAGNYQKGHVKIGPLDVSVENPIGSTRSGKEGKKSWTTTMQAHYGYVKRTVGADGDQVDVFIKEGTANDYTGPVFVVDQFNPKTGRFDEHKAMIGYRSQAEAATAYDAHFADKSGPKRRHSVVAMPMESFSNWAKNGDTTAPLSQAGKQADQAQAEIEQSTGKLSRPRTVRAPGESQKDFEYRRAAEATAARQASRTTIANEQASEDDIAEVANNVENAEIVQGNTLPDQSDAKGLSKQAAESIELLAGLFRKRVVFFSAEGSADGFWRKGNTIYVNTHAGVTPLRVLGHEMLHVMKAESKDSYKTMLNAVQKFLTDAELTAQFKDYFAQDAKLSKWSDQQITDWLGDNANKDMITEEWMADLSGNRFGEADFWTSVFQKVEDQHGAQAAKGIINRLRLAIVRVINNLLAAIKGGTKFGVDARMAQNLEEIRAALAEGFAQYAIETKRGVAGAKAEGGVAKFAKPAEERKARTLDEVRTRVAQDYGLTVSSDPMQLRNGAPFSSLDMNERGPGLLIDDADVAMRKMMDDALTEAGVPTEIANQVKTPSKEDVDQALKQVNGARYWYETSANGFVRGIFNLGKKLSEHLIDIVAGTSGGQKPTDNLKIAIAAMALDMQGRPVTVGTRDESSLTAALSPAALGTHKFGNFSDTMQTLGGLRAGVKPLPTIDLQMAKVFGVTHASIASDPRMYEAMSRFLIKLRDAQNAKLEKGQQPYESWQLQALIWVAKRDTTNPDSYDIAMPKILKQLQDSGIPTPGGKITTATLMDPRTPDVMAPTSKTIPATHTATVETRTMLTKVGKSSAAVYEQVKQINAPWAKSLVNEFESIQRRSMRALGERQAPKPGNTTKQPSIISQLMSVIMGKSAGSHELSRVDTNGKGMFEDDASPNMRIPLTLAKIGGTLEGGGTIRYTVGADQRAQFLAVLGKHLKQAAQAASQFVPTTIGAHDTFSILIKRYDKADITEAQLEQIGNLIGRPLNYSQVPNGWRLDINIGGFDETPQQQAENRDINRIRDALGRFETAQGVEYDWHELPQSYDSDYLTPGDYGKHIRSLENAISRSIDPRRSGTRLGNFAQRRLGDYQRVVGQIQDIAKQQEQSFSEWERDARELGGKRGVKLSLPRSDAASNERAGGRTASNAEALPSYGTATPGAVAAQGFHYSSEERSTLDGRYYGTGAKGREADRVNVAADKRLKERIYFYVDAGKGITPEQGVGAKAHTVNLNNLYDASAETWIHKQLPRGLSGAEIDNAFESAVIDNGFDGYVADFGTQRAAVLLGRHNVPVSYTGMGKQSGEVRQAKPKADPLAGRNLPAGRMTGAEWKALVPEATMLEDGKSYYKDDVARAVGPKFSPSREAQAEIARMEASVAKTPSERVSANLARVKRALAGEIVKDEQGNLIAPNGRKSNLTEAQYRQTRSPEFMAWFGDWLAAHNAKNGGGVWGAKDVSKVVDQNGEPQAIYHGTEKGGFTVMRPEKGDKHRSPMLFATDDKTMARTYSWKGGEIDLTQPEFAGTVTRKVGKDWFVMRKNGDPSKAYDVYGNYVDINQAEGYFSKKEADYFRDTDLEEALRNNGEVQPGIYSLFLNIRNPQEEDFEGSNWDGDTTGRYEVFDGTGDQVYQDDGGRFFSLEDAEDKAQEVEGTFNDAINLGMSTNTVAEEAKRMGQDGAIIRNVEDDGGRYPGGVIKPATVYVFFDSNQAKSATQNTGAFSRTNDDIRYSPGRTPFYSELSRQIEKAPDRIFGPAAQVKLWLAGNAPKLGIKKEEIQWSGINEWLDLQGKAKVSKADVLGYLAGNGVQIEEVEKGAPGYNDDNPQLPEGSGLEVVEPDEELHGRMARRYSHVVVDTASDSPVGWGDGEAEAIANAYNEHPKYWDKVGATEYGQWQLPGGENYRELLLTLPGGETKEQAIKRRDAAWEEIARILPEDMHPMRQTAWAEENAPELFAKWQDASRVANNKPADSDKAFRSSHWKEPNILAHIRFNDRTDADGNKVLFIEEVQSDWGQKGKKEGFSPDVVTSLPSAYQVFDADGNHQRTFADMASAEAFIAAGHGRRIPGSREPQDTSGWRVEPVSAVSTKKGTPSAPFVTDTKAWVALALKRMMRYAADNGYDKVAFINGAQSADRYKLSKSVDEISWRPNGGGKDRFVEIDTNDGTLKLLASPGKGVAVRSDFLSSAEGKNLEDIVGKDMAGKIFAEPEGKLSGEGLDIGGEGMKTFYDAILPQVANSLLKKMGGKMETVAISNAENRYEVEQRRDGMWAVRQDGKAFGPPLATQEAAQKVADRLNGAMQQPGFTVPEAAREPLPMFSTRRALNGDFSAQDHVVPDIAPWLGNSQLVDLAYVNGKPIRLNVGRDDGPGRGFGAMHLAANEDREARRAVEKETGDRGEDIVRSVLKALSTAGATLHKDPNTSKYLLRLPLANKALALADNKDYYSIITVLPSAQNKFGTADWTGRLTFPATADATSAEPLSPTGAKSSLASRSGMGSFVSARFNVKPPEGFNQPTTRVVVKKTRTVDRDAMAADGLKKSTRRIVGDSGRQYDPKQRSFFKDVGRDIEQQNLVERTLAYLKNDFAKKMAVGIVDQFRGLRDLNDNGAAYLLARLSKGTAGAFDAFLHHGKLSLKGGAYDADRTGGFVQRLGVPLHGELDDFLWYVAAHRAESLMPSDREHLFTPAHIAAGKSLANGTTTWDYTIQTGPTKGQVTRNRAEIYSDANRVFQEFQKNALDMAEKSGLIDGASRKYWENEFYVPFYRVSEESGEFIGKSMGNALVRQQAFKKLKGGTDKLNSDLLSNTLLNISHLIEASAKNRAAGASLKAAENMGVAHKALPGEKKTVWYMENGQKVEYKVDDPFVMTAITSLEYAGMNNGIMKPLSQFKHWLTIGVTASPAFKVRNLIRDSVQAIGTSELSYNPIANVVTGFRQTNHDSQEYVSALASGALIRFGTILEGNESARTRQLIRSGVKDSTILNSDNKVRAFYDRFLEPVLEAYNELGNRSEEINRAALYNQLVKQGKSHAEAALMARDLMDFSMQGSFNTVRFLTQVVPFLNARLQGLYKLGRSSKDYPRKMAAVTGAAALLSIGLMLAYDDDDEWKRREDWDRDNYWWFKVGGEAFRIPKPFEIGAVATMAERGLEYMINDEMTGERFRHATANLIKNQLAMNPVPQAVKPIIDLYANNDSFTDRPIESMGMQRLDPEKRYNASTSMTARGLSQAVGGALSPVQIDHLVRGYFGWLGSFVNGGADMAARALSNEPTKPTMDYWKFATQGIVSEADGGSSRYVSQMYEQAKELEQAHATWRSLLKDGKVEEAKAYREDNADKLRRYGQVEAVKKIETNYNQRIHRIEISDIDPDQKKEQIKNINKLKEAAAKRIAPGVSSGSSVPAL